MSLKSLSFVMICLCSSFLVGCGADTSSENTEGAPPPVESGDDGYDQYNSSGKDGPGS